MLISSKRKTVLFFHLGQDTFCGAEKNLYRLITNLRKEKVLSILVTQKNNELSQKLISENYKVIFEPFDKHMDKYDKSIIIFNPNNLIKVFKSLINYNKKVVKIINKYNPDYLWCGNIRFFLTIYISAIKTHTKLIWNIWSEPQGKLFLFFHYFGTITADLINIEYSTQLFNLIGRYSFRKNIKKKTVLLYSGFSDFEKLNNSNIKTELSLQDDSIIILSAANIIEAKGQLDIIKAFKLINNNSHRTHLLIAGTFLPSRKSSISYFEKLRDYISKNELQDRIHLIGWRKDINDIMKSCDIFVTTSYSESMPDSIREVMNYSKPVVVTNAGGTSEAIVDKKSGFLFEPGNIIQLSSYIDLLVNSKNIRVSMGKKGKQFLHKRFSNDLYAKKFENMIHNKLIIT